MWNNTLLNAFASAGRTVHHDGDLFDSSCVASQCIETRNMSVSV